MKNSSKPPQITIRGLARDKQKRIQELANDSGYSMEGFIRNLLSDVAERHEVAVLDSKYAELQKETLLALAIATEEIKRMQEVINFVMGGETE